MEGFAYSNGLASLHDQLWTYEALNTFLTSPKDFIPGTKMTFAGLKDAADRAAVIDFLRQNTINPPPLPEPKAPEPQAEAAPATQTAAATTAAPAAAPEPPADFNTLLASANPAAGEKIFNKCKACHNADQGGPNKVGPNLWGVVGRPIAHHEGFNYSSALSEKSGETWTYDHLNTFLTSPKAWAPGTKMTFAGLSKVEDRADVIAYLRTRADTPQPLP